MKYSYRITKYKNVNEHGNPCSPPSEWTCFNDVGKKVTLEEYEEIETQYIDFILHACRLHEVETLIVREPETHFSAITLNAGDSVPVTEVTGLIRSLLREELWCKLSSARLELHFGYDFYLYLLSDIPPVQLKSTLHTQLNVQVFQSPYA